MLDIFDTDSSSLELFWEDQISCWKCLGEDWILDYFTENIKEFYA